MELCEQREEAKSCKMAAVTHARTAEKPDFMTKLDDLFAEFWKKIVSREQQAKTHKPAKRIPTVLPARTQRGYNQSPKLAPKKMRLPAGLQNPRERPCRLQHFTATNTLQNSAYKQGKRRGPSRTCISLHAGTG
ncbi:Hypothetical predicted protein [Pelobates cultripes]|uniref:Uncharacterized protein n=1 Tax=Pelobates cultripes TaxID=61616 RepID=A0AAD1WBA7_PELCU|nr:Hypothetical predicted protein [Pelobates cultripes]